MVQRYGFVTTRHVILILIRVLLKRRCTDGKDLAVAQQTVCGGQWGGIAIPFSSVEYRDVGLKMLDGKITSDAEIQQIKAKSGSALAR